MNQQMPEPELSEEEKQEKAIADAAASAAEQAAKDTKLEALEAEKAKWDEEKKELEKAVSPNWREIRAKEERLITALKAAGKEVDGEGNPIDEKKISIEDIEQRASATARKEMLDMRREDLLESYSVEDRKVVNHYFEKLTQGEKVDMSNIKTFIKQAERAAFPEDDNKIQKARSGSGGKPPRAVETPTVSEENVSSLANAMNIKLK